MAKTMRLLLAPNAFKGSFGAVRVAEVWERALGGVPGVETLARPLSDGGDGALEVWERLLAAPEAGSREGAGAGPGTGMAAAPPAVAGPMRVWFVARDPLARPARTPVLWDPVRGAGWVETALACGLARVPEASRDPLAATTYGCGQLLLGLLELGAEEVTLGLGGSATVDGGLGLGRALGYRFLSGAGTEIERPEGLRALGRILAPAARPWAGCRVRALTDVGSPLLGSEGAARVFGPQKFPPGRPPPAGALECLEEGLERMAERMAADLGVDARGLGGAGAAGGLGAGLAAFAGARLEGGAAHFLDLAGVPALFGAAGGGPAAGRVDAVLTGEGSYDAQSGRGKLAGELRALCAARGVPLAVVAGSADAAERRGELVLTGTDLDPPAERLDEAALGALAVEAARRLARRAGG